MVPAAVTRGWMPPDHRTRSSPGKAFRVAPGEGGRFWGSNTLSIGAREFGVRSMEGDGIRAGGGWFGILTSSNDSSDVFLNPYKHASLERVV